MCHGRLDLNVQDQKCHLLMHGMNKCPFDTPCDEYPQSCETKSLVILHYMLSLSIKALARQQLFKD